MYIIYIYIYIIIQCIHIYPDVYIYNTYMPICLPTYIHTYMHTW